MEVRGDVIFEWAALAVLCIIVVLIFREMYRKPFQFPPGPMRVPLLGSTAALSFGSTLPHLVFEDLGKTYGKAIGLYLFGQPVVILRDYDLIRQAFSRLEFSGREQTFVIQNRSFFTGKGIVFGQGEMWATQRRFAMQQFHTQGIGQARVEALIQNELAELVAMISNQVASGNGELEIYSNFCISSCNCIFQMLAGRRFRLDDPVIVKLIADTDAVMRMAGPGNILSLLPWSRHVAPDATGFKALCQLRDETCAMFAEMIEEHRTTSDAGRPRDYVDAFLEEMKSDKAEERGFTQRQLEIILMDFFQVGIESINSTLCWGLLLLASHPDILVRLQVEIDALKGAEPLTWEDRHRLPFLQATINEIHRYGTVTNVAVPHFTSFQAASLGGHTIPRHTLVLPDVYQVHHDTSYWHKPEQFRPDRFLNAQGQLVHEPRLLAFGTGRRQCLGESLGRMEIFLFLGGLLQAFHLELPSSARPVDLTPQAGVTYKPRQFQLRCRPRSRSCADDVPAPTLTKNEENNYCTKRASFSSKIHYKVEREI